MGVICNIVFRTIPRCGVTALLFLVLGFYLIFPSCNIIFQVFSEAKVPYILLATSTKEYIDLNTLLQVDGIKNASPVLRLDAEMSVEDYILQCEVKAVYSSFLNLKFTEGNMFPDNSNMPYLVLNNAAANSFALDGDITTTLSAGTLVLLRENNEERKAVICGIFDDDSDSPSAFMSYDCASQKFSKGSGTELLLYLGHKGDCEEVVKAIRRLGINASFDENQSLRWKLMKQQLWESVISSIGFLICGAYIIKERRFRELEERSGEILTLLCSGLNRSESTALFSLRILVTEILSILLAAFAAWIIGTFSFIAICISTILGLFLQTVVIHCSKSVISSPIGE